MNASTTHSSQTPPGPVEIGSQSDLVQFCLPDAAQDEARRYAWTISVTLLFLAIGGVGCNERVLALRVLSPIEEQVMEHIEITQTPPPPPAETTDEPEDSKQDEPEAPSFVAVTLDTPNINFSVPTVGGILVSADRATAPPMRPPVAKKEAAPATFNLQLTGSDGDYPAPPFPQDFVRRGIQGTVIVRIHVDPEGRKQEVEVEQTSGYSQLDDHIKLWVSKYYVRFNRADGPRIYRAMFTFKIDK